MQAIESFAYTIEDFRFNLGRNRIAFFVISTQHLLAMRDNACLGGGWSVLTGVSIQRDARCGRNKIRQSGCLDVIANDASQVDSAAQVSQVSSYVSCASQGICLRTDLH